MKTYKHYSFDLWMTLIKSNPAFKQERAKFFFDNFNYSGKSLEEVAAVFRQVDVMCNAINEKTGGSITSEEMYLMVISAINNYSHPFENIDMALLYAEMEQLLFKHLPVVYCENTARVLKTLKQREGITVSLLSNTAFVKGSTLRQVLRMLELDGYLDFQLYSDETGISKPDKKMFQAMLSGAAVAQNRHSVPAHEVVHTGDNIIADIYGAKAAGIHGILINSNNTSITSLLN